MFAYLHTRAPLKGEPEATATNRIREHSLRPRRSVTKTTTMWRKKAGARTIDIRERERREWKTTVCVDGLPRRCARSLGTSSAFL